MTASAVVPPAFTALQDVSHPAAVAPVFTAPAPATPAPAAPVTPVSPTPAAGVAAGVAVDEIGPVTASDPLRLPAPVQVQRSPLTVTTPEQRQDPSPAAGIAPESVAPAVEVPGTAPAAPTSAPAVAPVAPVAAVASAAAAIAPVVEAADPQPYDPRIAGGVPTPPVITLAELENPAPAAHREVKASASVVELAGRTGIDLAALVGTGKGGKIIVADVKAAIAARKANSPSATPAAVTVPAVESAPVPDPVTVPAVESAPASGPVAIPAVESAPVPGPVAIPAAETTAVPTPMIAAQAPAPVLAQAPAPGTANAGCGEPTTSIRFTLTSACTITSIDDLTAMVVDKLPNLMVVSVALELSASGPVVVAQVAQTAAVDL